MWCRVGRSRISGEKYTSESRALPCFLNLTGNFSHLSSPGSDRLKNALIGLVRVARRARERGRQARKSLGAGVD